MSLRSYLMTVIGVLAVLLALGVWFYPANSDFRTENPQWNGVRAAASGYNIRPLDSLDGLPASPRGASLIVVPYLDFTPAELDQLRSFVSLGGRLILADDYGYGNRVLEYLGLKARFAGEMLLDPLINYKNSRLPRITRLQPDVLTANADNLVFNHATCLDNISGDEAIALSSPFAFLDINGDGAHEDNEPSGSLAAISRHPLGNGQVILIADPSIFINSMAAMGGNAALIRNLAATAEALYIDQSHLEQSDLNRSRNWLQKARGVAATPWGTGGLVIIALAGSLAPVWRRKKTVKGEIYDDDTGKKTADT